MVGDGASDLEWLPDATAVVGSDRTVHAVNTQLARLVGRRVAELIGRPAPDVIALHNPDGADWWRCVAGFDVDATLLPRIPEHVVHLRCGDRAREMLLTGRRVSEPDGGANTVCVALRRADRRVDAERQRRDLISTASHELRAPLTTVRGFTKTLLARWDRFDDATRRQMISMIDEDADRVTRLLTELLDISRIDAGRLPLHRRIVTLDTIVGPLSQRFAVEHPDRELRVEVPDDLPDLMVDPDRIAQVVSNLLDNARKYGGTSVTITAHAEDGAVRCAVIDDGGAIPSEQLERVFVKYARVRGGRPYGSGLGLYISRGIVTAHGGRIWADSSPESGTAFVFTLPTAEAQLSAHG